MKTRRILHRLLSVHSILIGSLVGLIFWVIPVAAKTPPMMVFASYETNTGTYPLGVAITNAIESKTGSKIRIVPTMTDAGKAQLLRSKEAHYTIIGGGTAWFMYSGNADFKTPDWGPQPLRVLWTGGTLGFGFMTRADSGIKQLSDLKGKRVYYVPGAHGPNSYNEAYLAFGGLTWKDVQQVKMPSYGAALKAVKEGAVDGGATSVTAPGARELEASNHGLYFLPTPRANKKGWENMLKVAPYWFPDIATTGAGITPAKPLEMPHYSTFVLAYSWMDDDLAMEITKAINESYDTYSAGMPALKRWTMAEFEKQLTNSFMPMHPGTIKYLKQLGKWTPEFDAWQKKTLAAEADRLKQWKAQVGKK